MHNSRFMQADADVRGWLLGRLVTPKQEGGKEGKQAESPSNPKGACAEVFKRNAEGERSCGLEGSSWRRDPALPRAVADGTEHCERQCAPGDGEQPVAAAV